jgi:dUTP pyrophosphatase
MFISDVSKLSRQSHSKVKIECSKKIVDNCYNIKETQYRDAMNNIEKNDGEYICFYCSRHLNYSGENNPNCKYNFDRNFFKEIDDDNKAYLLGWIASDGCIVNNSISIYIHKKDIKCLTRLRDIICNDIPINDKETDLVGFTISSKQCVLDICNYLKIQPGKKDTVVRLPNLPDYLTWSFLRGYFEGDGTVRDPTKRSSPDCSITSNSLEMLKDIQSFVKIPCLINNNNLYFCGTNSIDFLGKLYDNCRNNFLERKYDSFLSWLYWQPKIKSKNNYKLLPECRVYKTDSNAVVPYKTNYSDVGYDLTIIKEFKKINNTTILYDTGIKISIFNGLYAEIVPRSSLIKSGYILTNSIGIIDPSYHGNLLICLTKIDKDSPDITLPFRCCQLIFKKQLYLEITEVSSTDELYETESHRNEGGFGSTGK